MASARFDVAANIQTAADDLYVQLKKLRPHGSDPRAFAARLVEILETRRVRFLKLGALLRWARSDAARVYDRSLLVGRDSQSDSQLNSFLDNTLALLNDKRRSAAESAAEVSSDPRYDLKGALRVLSGNGYALPTVLTSWLEAQAKRVSVDTARTELDHAILFKLMHTTLPPPPCTVSVANGCLVIRAPHLYTLHLTLSPETEPATAAAINKDDQSFQWRFLAFELHVQPRRNVQSFALTLDQKKKVAKRLNEKLVEYLAMRRALLAKFHSSERSTEETREANEDKQAAVSTDNMSVQPHAGASASTSDHQATKYVPVEATTPLPKDDVLARGLHTYMLSVCRQLQMVILRRQFLDLRSRSSVAGLQVLNSPAHALAVEYWHDQRHHQSGTSTIIGSKDAHRYGFSLVVSPDQSMTIQMWPPCTQSALDPETPVQQGTKGQESEMSRAGGGKQDGADSLLQGFDERVSAESLLQRVVEAHATQRFRDFVEAVECSLSGRGAAVIAALESSETTLNGSSPTTAIDDEELPGSAAEAAQRNLAHLPGRSLQASTGDALLRVDSKALTCQTCLAGYQFEFALVRHDGSVRVTASDAPGGPRTGSVPGALRALLSQSVQDLLQPPDNLGRMRLRTARSTHASTRKAKSLLACFEDFRAAVHGYVELAHVRALAEQAHLPWPIFLKITFRCRSSSSKKTSAPLGPAKTTVPSEEARGSSALDLPELHEQRCRSLRDGAIFYVRHAYSGASGTGTLLSTPAMLSLPLDFFVAFYKTSGTGGPGDDVVFGATPPAMQTHSDTAVASDSANPPQLLLRRVIVVRERWGHARVRSRSGRESLRTHGAAVRWIGSAGSDIPHAADVLRNPHRLQAVIRDTIASTTQILWEKGIHSSLSSSTPLPKLRSEHAFKTHWSASGTISHATFSVPLVSEGSSLQPGSLDAMSGGTTPRVIANSTEKPALKVRVTARGPVNLVPLEPSLQCPWGFCVEKLHVESSVVLHPNMAAVCIDYVDSSCAATRDNALQCSSRKGRVAKAGDWHWNIPGPNGDVIAAVQRVCNVLQRRLLLCPTPMRPYEFSLETESVSSHQSVAPSSCPRGSVGKVKIAPDNRFEGCTGWRLTKNGAIFDVAQLPFKIQVTEADDGRLDVALLNDELHPARFTFQNMLRFASDSNAAPDNARSSTLDGVKHIASLVVRSAGVVSELQKLSTDFPGQIVIASNLQDPMGVSQFNVCCIAGGVNQHTVAVKLAPHTAFEVEAPTPTQATVKVPKFVKPNERFTLDFNGHMYSMQCPPHNSGGDTIKVLVQAPASRSRARDEVQVWDVQATTASTPSGGTASKPEITTVPVASLRAELLKRWQLL